MSQQEELPPVFEPTNQVDLISVENSKIVNVNLYSGRAEITRLYKFTVKTGQNLVNINGLPNALDRESLRVEGRGAATIHDVTISNMPTERNPEANQRLHERLREKRLLEDRLQRTKKGLGALETYLGSFNAEYTDSSKLASILQNYDDAGETLNLKVLELEESIKKVNIEINNERQAISGTQHDSQLRLKASIGVFAASEGEVAIALIYAVNGANWTAGYDIRVNMDTKEKPVRLVYKAAITQNTGESWEDVELNLETAAPTFGVALPTLSVQKLTSHDPNAVVYAKSVPRPMTRTAAMPRARRQAASFGSRGGGGGLEEEEEDGDEDMGFGLFDDAPGSAVAHRGVNITSKGNISATFRVPGLSTLPSDGSSHNVTVVQLDLDADMSWVAIPKVDTKVHLQAKVTNASEYTFLPGTASVYVDGSFIARTQVPMVSPQESFDCPLGLDPSIRITYHPLNKKISQSGFMSKSSQRLITQRITIFNSKTSPIKKLKIIDQLPISEIPNVTPKLLSPPLVVPLSEPISSISSLSVSGAGGADQLKKIPAPVKVSEGVYAQWEGAEEPGFDVDALGVDGKFYWMCEVKERAKANLVLQWEVVTPAKTPIYGM